MKSLFLIFSSRCNNLFCPPFGLLPHAPYLILFVCRPSKSPGALSSIPFTTRMIHTNQNLSKVLSQDLKWCSMNSGKKLRKLPKVITWRITLERRRKRIKMIKGTKQSISKQVKSLSDCMNRRLKSWSLSMTKTETDHRFWSHITVTKNKTNSVVAVFHRKSSSNLSSNTRTVITCTSPQPQEQI